MPGRLFSAGQEYFAFKVQRSANTAVNYSRGDGSSFALVRQGNVKTVLYMVNERAREARRLGGSRGMPPQEIFEFQAF